MNHARRLVALSLLLASALAAAAAPPGPALATESSAQRVLRLTAELESEPLGEQSALKRQWLLRWLQRTRDYTVVVCEILGPIPLESPPNSAELVAQQMLGNVAFQIRHPQVRDQVRLQLAGVESALRAYAVLLSRAPEHRIAYLDGLLAKQAAGTLSTHMAPLIDKACSDD